MTVRWTRSRMALALLLSAWAATLVVLGLWVLFDAGAQLKIPWRIHALAGIAAIAAGLFLFMARVADQVFPAVGQRLGIWLVEMVTFLVFLAGFVGAIVSYGGALA